MHASSITVRLSRKSKEALDVCSFELVHPEGEELPSFTAGAHIDVEGPTGLTRQYSLVNSPAERHRYLIAVLLDPRSRGGSAAMHQLEEGALLKISGPRNNFTLASPAGHSILIAGGIGITPILCMAEQLSMTEASFELHYACRSRSRTAFMPRISELSANPDRRFMYWDDEPMSPQLDLRSLLANAVEDAHIYVCGPKGFIDFVVATAEQVGRPKASTHFEHFGATAVPTDGDQPFQVKILRTGTVIEVPPGTTTLKALASHGVSIPFSCEQGICGACLTRVVSGIPEHRDCFLTDEEHGLNDQFTPCCSRSKSPLLVIDL